MEVITSLIGLVQLLGGMGEFGGDLYSFIYGFGTRHTRGFGWVGCGIAGALELVYRKGKWCL